METSTDNLTLQKDLSSYSSFFETQVPSSDLGSDVKENEMTNSENDKKDDSIEINGTVNVETKESSAESSNQSKNEALEDTNCNTCSNNTESITRTPPIDNKSNMQATDRSHMTGKGTPGGMIENDAIHLKTIQNLDDPKQMAVQNENDGQQNGPESIQANSQEAHRLDAAPDTELQHTGRISKSPEDKDGDFKGDMIENDTIHLKKIQNLDDPKQMAVQNENDGQQTGPESIQANNQEAHRLDAAPETELQHTCRISKSSEDKDGTIKENDIAQTNETSNTIIAEGADNRNENNHKTKEIQEISGDTPKVEILSETAINDSRSHGNDFTEYDQLPNTNSPKPSPDPCMASGNEIAASNSNEHLQNIIQTSTTSADISPGNNHSEEKHIGDPSQQSADINAPNASPTVVTGHGDLKKSNNGSFDNDEQTNKKTVNDSIFNETTKQGDYTDDTTLRPITVGDDTKYHLTKMDHSFEEETISKENTDAFEGNIKAKVHSTAQETNLLVPRVKTSNMDDVKSKSEYETPLKTEGTQNSVHQKGAVENSEHILDTNKEKTHEANEESMSTQNVLDRLDGTHDIDGDGTHNIDGDKEHEIIQPKEEETSYKEKAVFHAIKQLENSDHCNSKEDEDNRHVSGNNSWAITLETQNENSNAGDTGSQVLHKQPQTVIESAANSESTTATKYDNLYFTGRLPTLISRHDSSQSFSNPEHITNWTEVIAKKTEIELKQGISNNNREKNTGHFGDGGDDDGNNFKDSKKMQSANDDNIVNNTEGKERKVNEVQTPSRRIREIIKEMNDPGTKDIYSLSRETPLTPRSTAKRSKSAAASYRPVQPDDSEAIKEVQRENEPVKSEEKDDQTESANMTVEDITMVTSKVLGTTHVEDYHSKFDNMPHMKHISDYVHDNLDTKQSSLKAGGLRTDINEYSNEHKDYEAAMEYEQKDESENTDKGISSKLDSLPRHTKRLPPQHFPEKRSRIKFFEPQEERDDDDKKRPNLSISHALCQNSEKPENKEVQRSSSENDLKAIIASAKIAISNDTETTDSNIGFENSNTSELTIQGDNVSMVKRKISSRPIGSQKEVWSTPTLGDDQEALASLICSNCLQVDSNINTAGYCTNCQQYLCGTCITVHKADIETRRHEIVPSYCKNELAINKYIPATGYCVDCSTFLCMRCVVQHTGFRANRHHRIIQSSFISKPKDSKIEADAFLDEVQDKIDIDDSRASSKGETDEKRKRKLLSDLDKWNPYSSPFIHVPESLYPGPKTKLASSYAKNPKWVHSSIPNLPYLVQPKPIPDRAFHAAGHTRPRMIYTRPKMGFDAMAVKLKSLKARYKIKGEVRTSRRTEQVAFTARPAKARDNLSLPDIQSERSYASKGRSLKYTVNTNASFGRKEVEFIDEHCLSIPFPRGEKRTDIMAMTVLLNGKLVVLDRNNNNIKLFNKGFHCTAALQFQNRLVDICASNLCQSDVYAATPKHIYEISVERGMALTRKMKVEIKRIEGITHWKYGLAIISKKTNITWELRLLDYRGNLKSKLEIFNPFTLDIGSNQLHHITSSRGGKFISLVDTRNSCIITIDVTTRVVVYETVLEDGKCPTYITSDGEGNHNLYVACDNKVFQVSSKGKVLGALINKTKENGEVGCIVYNKLSDRFYVKTGKDTISVYQAYF